MKSGGTLNKILEKQEPMLNHLASMAVDENIYQTSDIYEQKKIFKNLLNSHANMQDLINLRQKLLEKKSDPYSQAAAEKKEQQKKEEERQRILNASINKQKKTLMEQDLSLGNNQTSMKKSTNKDKILTSNININQELEKKEHKIDCKFKI